MTRPARTRIGIVAALAVVAVAFTLSDARSQFGPTESIWRCGKCRAELGRGPTPPSLAKCRVCGARLRPPAGGGGGAGFFDPPVASTPEPERESAVDRSKPYDPSTRGELSDTGALVLKVIFGVFVATELLVLVGAVFVFAAANKTTVSHRTAAKDEVLDLD